MELYQDIPDSLGEAGNLLAQLPSADRLAFRIFGDIDLDGHYGHCVLAADADRLYYGSIRLNGDKSDMHSLPLRDVRDLRIQNFVGSGSLVVDRAEDSVEVARFSQTRAGDFEAVVLKLAELARQRAGAAWDDFVTVAGTPRSARKQARCPQCGRALSLRAEVCLYCTDKRRLVVRLAALVKPHWVAFSAGMLITLATTLLALIPPWLTKAVFDRAILPRNLRMLMWLMAAYAGCFVGVAILSSVRIRVMGWLGQNVIYDLRMKAFDQLQRLSLRYYESKQTGRLMTRVTSDTERIERFTVEGLQDLIVDVLTIVLILVIMFRTNVLLTMITVAPLPVVFTVVFVFSRRIKSIYRKAWRTNASLSAHLADIIPGVRVVKGFTREQAESQEFGRRSRRLLGHNLRMFRMRASVFPFTELFGRIGYVMVWTIGGYMAIQQFTQHPELLQDPRGHDTIVGTLFMFTALLWQLYAPIGRLSRLTDQVQRATTSAERVFELLDAFPDVSEPARPKTLGGRARGHVEFRNVSFAYEAGVPVLNDVNLDVVPGEMIGIVGHSGVGKSTLASLLLRFYDPDAGQVLLDGVDVRELSSKELRGNIGLVLQEPTLFHGSVLDNIRYGQQDATAELVIAAAKIANAHNFLMRLPEGYDTQIGERGVRLSQGEKQRISIARAILRDPPILLLDEATASVDTETERLIQAALDHLVKGRTVLAIAHRLSTLRNATRIIVLADGNIAEVGTHDELIAREGLYYQLCQAQSVLGRDITASPPRRRVAVEEDLEPLVEFEPEEERDDVY